MTHGRGAADSGPDRHVSILQYPDVALQIVLDDAEPVADALATILRGWTPVPRTQADHDARLSSVLGTDTGYAAQSGYLEETIHGLGLAGAACAVIADLAQDYFVSRPGSLALHCAAFRYNNRLVAMTGPTRAGKSTLAARLTQEPDMTVFCDDVLPMLPDGEAVGLGIAPRLRLPLPDACSDAFRAHVARHMGPADARYAYLCAPTVAPHGTRAPLSVLLILDRRADASARLHAVSDNEAMHFLLAQNMSDLQTADQAFGQLRAVMDAVTCLRLVYADLEEAVALIRLAFGSRAPVHPDVPIGPVLPTALAGALPQAEMSPDICWTRQPDVTVQTTGDSAFLWVPGQQMIWHMNALGLAVWTLLEIPGSAHDIARALAGHFTDPDEHVLTADVNALLQALAKGGLIQTVDPMALSG
jgi:hypothetical protein